VSVMMIGREGRKCGVGIVSKTPTPATSPGLEPLGPRAVLQNRMRPATSHPTRVLHIRNTNYYKRRQASHQAHERLEASRGAGGEHKL
jgi:hypothetical protein